MALLNLSLGILIGTIVFLLSGHPQIMIAERHEELLMTTLFVIVAGTVFSHFGKLGASGYLKQEDEKEYEKKQHEGKYEILKSIAGSIAHEMRNPLNAIRLTMNQILDSSLKLNGNISNPQSPTDYHSLTVSKSSDAILNSIKRANEVINMLLSNLKDESQNIDLSIFSSAKIL